MFNLLERLNKIKTPVARFGLQDAKPTFATLPKQSILATDGREIDGVKAKRLEAFPKLGWKDTLANLPKAIEETWRTRSWMPDLMRKGVEKVSEVMTPKNEEEAKRMGMFKIPGTEQYMDVFPMMGKIGVGKKVITPVVKKVITPAQKVINALKTAKPIRKAQEAVYTKARGAKLAKMMGVAKKTAGEKGFYAEKGALRGEMPKVQFESIRKQIGQIDIDNLFNQVKNSPVLSEWEKLPAREGLAKLFGKTGGQVPTRGELKLLKDVFGEEFTKSVLDNRTLIQKMGEAGFQLANLPRSIMASFDLSAPLRQGIFSAARHPKMFFNSFAKQFKTFASEKAYKALNDEIASRPTFELMRKNKLAITELGSSLSTREEAFMSNWAEKIPLGVGKVVRASGRAYTGFLNKFRADMFDDFIKQGKNLGVKDPKFLESAASFVNHATGRGSLGALETAAVPLNSIFFSPRLTMSRLNLINPIYYAGLQPVVRKEALKSLLSFGAAAASVAGLMKLGGAEIETNPRSSDFMKPKFGNKRYDILGGFQQPIRLASQFISGKIISSTTGRTITLGEGYKPLSRADIVQRFLEYKTSPIASFVLALAKGQTAIGGKLDVPTEVINRFIPMVIQDMIDLYKEEGLVGIPMAVPAIFGVGVQSYGGVESYDLRGKDYPKLNKELQNINATIGFPSMQAFGKELDSKEYKEFKEVSGKIIADALTEMIEDEDYKKMSDYEKKQLINRVVDQTKSKVRERLFLDKKIQNELKRELVKKGIDEEKAEKIALDIYSAEFGKESGK